jgi:hypothetical protein
VLAMIISKDLFLLGDQDYLRLPKDEKRAMGHKSAKRLVFGLAGMGQGRSGVGNEGTSCEPNNRLGRVFRYVHWHRPGVGGPPLPRSPNSRPSDPVVRGVRRGRTRSPPRLLTPGTNMAVGPLNCAGSFPCPSLCMRTQTPAAGVCLERASSRIHTE